MECFARVPKGARFCKNCGTKVEVDGDAVLKERLEVEEAKSKRLATEVQELTQQLTLSARKLTQLQASHSAHLRSKSKTSTRRLQPLVRAPGEEAIQFYSNDS